MSFDCFLKIDGVDGESTDKRYSKWIEVLSYSHGISNAGSSQNRTAGRCDHQDVSVVKALEWGLSALNQLGGRFLQVSGLRFTARAGKVIKAQVAGGQGRYADLKPEATYTVATNSYLAGGGDGFAVLKDQQQGKESTYVSLCSLVQMTLEGMSPLDPKVEGRITLKP